MVQSEEQNEEQVNEPHEKQSKENGKLDEKQSAKQLEWQYENDDDGSGFGTKEDRLAMVRHLIDNLGMDVNALVPFPGTSMNEAPIQYIQGSTVRTGNTRDITWLLLDRGANLAPAYKMAKKSYPKFIEDVEASKKTHNPKSTEDVEAWMEARNPKFIEDAEAEKKARQPKNGCRVQ
ncbi:hypothetical protein G6514_002970 [Epicoccum nigrum]|nr:hypothetical protein G6514_002970 [Epicoccum nigrum]